MTFSRNTYIALATVSSLLFLFPLSTLRSTWIDEVKEGEKVLCSNLPNQIHSKMAKSNKGESFTFLVDVYRNKESSLNVEIRGALDDQRDRLITIGKKFKQCDEFMFGDRQWKIILIGVNGLYVKRINGQEELFGYQHCSTSFVHLKLIKH